MKNSFILSILVLSLVAFSACDLEPEKPKSDKCEIITFTESGKIWSINNNAGTISAAYLKSEKDRLANAAPQITVSPGATVNPKSGDVVNLSDGSEVEYTVTAEDGKTQKVYKAKATETSVN